jgi:hypothetical protein
LLGPRVLGELATLEAFESLSPGAGVAAFRIPSLDFGRIAGRLIACRGARSEILNAARPLFAPARPRLAKQGIMEHSGP